MIFKIFINQYSEIYTIKLIQLTLRDIKFKKKLETLRIFLE